MENNIKLRPVQLEQLSKVRAQRTQLTKALQEADQREKDLLALFFEEAGITGTINGVSLNGDTLSFVVQEPKVKAKTPTKKSKELKEKTA